jgi:hypothetical protein
MRLLICGDRKWNARRPIAELLKQYPADTVVIHGGAARGLTSLRLRRARPGAKGCFLPG